MTDPFDRDPAASYDAAVALAPGVRRLTCENPSPMTFTGTQTYLVGEGEVALIDPGPDRPAHRAAILSALAPGERIATILLTHTHVDHSPGTAALARETGAEVLAFGPHGAGMSARMRALEAAHPDLGGREGADRAFRPDRTLADGEAVRGAGWTLTAVHTPGHLSNHLAFRLDDGPEGAPIGGLFSGDHLMAWATTMVSPPDGDMTAFMASLRRLQGTGAPVCWPGHGAPVADPEAMIAHQIRHREGREAQILAALPGPAAAGAAAMDLTREIYADVDPALHGAASRNVLSHLLGMLEDGRAAHDGPLGPEARFRRGG